MQTFGLSTPQWNVPLRFIAAYRFDRTNGFSCFHELHSLFTVKQVHG